MSRPDLKGTRQLKQYCGCIFYVHNVTGKIVYAEPCKMHRRRVCGICGLPFRLLKELKDHKFEVHAQDAD